MASTGAERGARWGLYFTAAILLVAVAVRFLKIDWSFSNNGIDEGTMLQRAALVSEGLTLYSEIPCDQAPLAFLLGAMVGGDVFLSRALVAGLSVAAVLACMEASRNMRGQGAMWLTGIVLAVDFAFVRESRLFSLDALCAVFIAFALLAFIVHIRSGSVIWLTASGLLVGLSAAMKLHGAVVLLGLIMFIILEARRNAQRPRRTATGIMALVAAACAPLVILLLALGPGEMIDGMVFDQGQRGFDAFLKLSVPAFFALNAAYLLPFLCLKRVWKLSAEARALMLVACVMLAYTIVQPLVFLHHMVLLSPPLAILSGVLISEAAWTKKGIYGNRLGQIEPNKSCLPAGLVASFLVANLVVSGGLVGYGLAAQDRPVLLWRADILADLSDEEDWVISGDPLIASEANRLIPPEMVNVAYRRQPDLTLEDIESAIVGYDVSVVIVCYRLNDIEGLVEMLGEQGFTLVAPDMTPVGEDSVLDLFQEGIEPVSFYVR